MVTIAFTSATESVKYLLNLWISRQENIIKLEEPYITYLVSDIYYLPLQGSAGITSQIEAVLNQLHQDWIKIPTPAEVRDYLLRYPDLTDILLFVCKVARERVGMYPELSLEVYHDPEIEDEYLTLYVRKQDYDENILDKIEDIRKQYEQNLIGRSGWLLVTTDFHLPRY